MSQTPPVETDPSRPSPQADTAYRIALRVASACGVFSIIVCVLLLYDFGRRASQHPLDSASYNALRYALEQKQDDEKQKKQLRDFDLRLREEFFRQRTFTMFGSWLLLGSVSLCVLCATTAGALRRKLPMPGEQLTTIDVEARWTGIGRWSIVGVGILLGVGTLALSAGYPSRLPDELLATGKETPGDTSPTTPGNGSAEATPPLTEEELAEMWPRFRGPQGSGISTHTDVPTSWDVTTDEGVLWKTPIPLPGLNSPIVIGKRVFLCGATKDAREVYCFDADLGTLRWKKDVPGDPNRAGEEAEPAFSGYAAPTMAGNGQAVFVLFGNGDMVAFDHAGNQLWAKSLGYPENSYGHSTSLETYKNLVLVQYDYGEVVKKTSAKLFAFDAESGEPVWEVDRPVITTWTSPILINHKGTDQLITCSDPWVISYNPADGSEIWRAKVLSPEAGPSPVYANGLLYVGNEYCEFTALSPDGKGDITKDAQTTEKYVNWTSVDGLPDTCSPLVTDEFALLMPSSGYFTCMDAATGEFLWDHEFEYVEFTASPSMAGDLIYLVGQIEDEEEEDEDGYPMMKAVIYLAKVTRDGCEVVGECPLGEGSRACPAFADGRIYLRGEKHLFCIGK